MKLKLHRSLFTSAAGLLMGMLAFAPGRAQENYTWERTNGPVGGGALTMISYPGGMILAGLDGGGVFALTPGTQHWENLSEGLGDPWVQGLAVDSSGGIYAATRQGLYYAPQLGGIFEMAESELVAGFLSAVGIDANGQVFVGTPGGLVRSRDNGQTWTLVDSSLTSVTGFVFISDTLLFLSRSGSASDTPIGVFRSRDGGATWRPSDQGLGSISVADIARAPNGVLYVATTSAGVYRSTNDGGHWTAINAGLPSSVLQMLAINSRGDVFTASIDRIGVYRLLAGATTWEQTGLPVSRYLSLLVTPGDTLHASTTGDGVVRSGDNGSSWVQLIEGFWGAPVLALHNSGDFIWAGTTRGVFRSSDEGDNWPKLSEGLPITNVRGFAQDASGRLFVAMDAGLFVSMDLGESYVQIQHPAINAGASVIWRAPNDHLYLLLSNSKALRSEDHGANWEDLSGTLGSGGVIGFVATDEQTYFAGARRGVLRSKDAGRTWSPANAGLTGTNMNTITVTGNGTLFVSDFRAGLFRSDNEGESWERVSLPGSFLFFRFLLPLPDNSVIAAGEIDILSGLFLIEDGDQTWRQIDDGLLNKNVFALALAANGRVFAGTLGAGVFRTTEPRTAVALDSPNIPARFILHQNHPNPFNPGSTIRFDLHQPATVSLDIYNLFGQRVRRLIHAHKMPGTHSFKWDGRDEGGQPVASGIYLYQLRTPGAVQTRKMVLSR